MLLITTSGCPEGFVLPPDLRDITVLVQFDDGSGVVAVVLLERAMPTGLFLADTTGTTSAAGVVVFRQRPFGTYRVTLQSLPVDALCPTVTQELAVAAFGEPTVSFACTRTSGSGTRSFLGVLTVAGGDLSHDPFVFAAGDAGKGIEFITILENGRISILAPVLGPSALPPLSALMQPDGTFVAVNTGVIAGIGNVEIVVRGTLAGNTLVLTIEVGNNGALPNGTPIVYRFEGTDPLAPRGEA